jgi:hypothetical protein
MLLASLQLGGSCCQQLGKSNTASNEILSVFIKTISFTLTFAMRK